MSAVTYNYNYKYALHIAILALILPMAQVATHKRNYEAKYTKANVPLWKQRACEKAQKYKANSHYICDDKDDVKCLPGWQGDLCQVPMCRKNCDPMNGYCQRPGECRCRIGYTGELCDKCIPLPGCQHGDCTKPFECLCRPGWDGLFCTEPTCRQGCHNTRGYCEAPGECRCRIGWAGRNCSDCSVMPGCQHGTCTKPLECICMPGYTGILCQTPICSADCHKQHGYCKKPGECRCKVGWTGEKCDQCFPYPGCVNGDCEKPWECNCKPGWGGLFCDEKLSYCKENLNICENNGKCVSLTKEDGNYRCHCKQGYLGKNCEIVDEFLLTSTAAPRITPPPLPDSEEDDFDKMASIDSENSIVNELKMNMTNFNATALKNQTQLFENFTNVVESLKMNLNMTANEKKETENHVLLNNTTSNNATKTTFKLSTIISQDIFGGDIIGTATTTMNGLKASQLKKVKTKTNVNGTLNASQANVTTISNVTTIPSILNTTGIGPKTTTTTLSPLNKLDDDKNLLSINSKPVSNKVQTAAADDDEDEECTDDNDEDCEYEDEDDDDDEDEDEDDDAK